MIYNVRDFGVIGDGLIDDTLAIQNVITLCQNNQGGSIYFPAGIYKIQSLFIHADVTLYGDGRNCTILKTNQPDQDVLTISGPGVKIHDLGFDSFIPRTAGSYLNFFNTSYECHLEDFHLEKAFIGITLSSAAATLIDFGSIRNLSSLPNSCGILVNGGNEQFLHCISMDNAADQQPTAGIRIENTGCINITNCSLIHCTNDLLILGGYSIYCLNSFFDTALTGIRILAQRPVQRSHFIGNWTSSHQEHGFLIEPNSPAVIEDIEIIGHQSFFNKLTGIYLGHGNHVKVEGSSSRHNQGTGIHLAGSDYVILTGNDTTDNASGINGSALHQIIANNF